MDPHKLLNSYKSSPLDFTALASHVPEVGTYAKGSRYDWGSPDALRAITKALLARDFGLTQVTLPADRLCPPVPQRLAYLCWVASLPSLADCGACLIGIPWVFSPVRTFMEAW